MRLKYPRLMRSLSRRESHRQMALSGAFWRFLGGLRHRSLISVTTYNAWPKSFVPSPKTRTNWNRNRGLRPSESQWDWDLASAQSPVDRIQRWQRYQRLRGRFACD